MVLEHEPSSIFEHVGMIYSALLSNTLSPYLAIANDIFWRTACHNFFFFFTNTGGKNQITAWSSISTDLYTLQGSKNGCYNLFGCFGSHNPAKLLNWICTLSKLTNPEHNEKPVKE